jgi:hypothetical protein
MVRFTGTITPLPHSPSWHAANTLRGLHLDASFASDQKRSDRVVLQGSVVAFLDEGDHAGERAPVIELGA